MDAEEKLFALMAIAEEHHSAIKAAIDGLVAERDRMDATRVVMSKQLRDVARAAEDASGAVDKAVREALTVVLAQAVNATAGEVGRAFKEEIDPMLQPLQGVVSRATEVEGKLRRALVWFSWRWLAMIAAGSAGVLLALWLGGLMAMTWAQHEVDRLAEQRAALAVEVADLQTNVEAWKKKAGRAKLESCGDQHRLCVRVDPRTAYGDQRDYFVLRGY